MKSGRRQIRDYLARRFGVPEIPFRLEALAGQGFAPHLVFDVGAHRGDFAVTCRAVWTASPPTVVCFEALGAGLTRLREMEKAGWIELVEGLVGAEPRDRVPLHEMETASSVLSEHVPQNAPVGYHPMRTLAQVMTEKYAGRTVDLLKIDTQGYELEVLKGLGDRVANVRIVLAELNLIDIHKGVPLFHEVVGWLADHGFVAYDVCGLTRRPLDRALWQMDVMFVRSDDPLRTDKRWQA